MKPPTSAGTTPFYYCRSYMFAFLCRLGKILEVEEVVEALMEGIVTNQKMVFVPPQLNIGLLSEM